jgi:hypothetical protein
MLLCKYNQGDKTLKITLYLQGSFTLLSRLELLTQYNFRVQIGYLMPCLSAGATASVDAHSPARGEPSPESLVGCATQSTMPPLSPHADYACPSPAGASAALVAACGFFHNRRVCPRRSCRHRRRRRRFCTWLPRLVER